MLLVGFQAGLGHKVIPGNALVVDPTQPFTQLNHFGSCLCVCTHACHKTAQHWPSSTKDAWQYILLRTHSAPHAVSVCVCTHACHRDIQVLAWQYDMAHVFSGCIMVSDGSDIQLQVHSVSRCHGTDSCMTSGWVPHQVAAR